MPSHHPEKRRTGLVLDPVFERHATGWGHPERPQRLSELRKRLDADGLTAACTIIPPTPAERESLLSVHTESYLRRLEQACRAGEKFIDTPDSQICPESWQISLLAAGSVIEAADLVARGQLDNAFCAIRPPGHHAESGESMGFCLLNNIALAARRLTGLHGLERVAILDWDVHHGNGTQHIFEEDPAVFFVSLHQSPLSLYPGTGFASERGKGDGLGTILNIPLEAGTSDEQYLAAFENSALASIEKFAPQFLLISAGFDAHRNDPLAGLSLSSRAFEMMSLLSVELAWRVCGGRVVTVLEGGYDLEVLADCVSFHIRALLGTAEGPDR